MNNNNVNNRVANNVGILTVDTWRFYINNFGCRHFKGTGIEDNYYLLRPIYLNCGDLVKSKRKFVLAKEESNLIEGLDYILYNHLDAVLAAKIIYQFNTLTFEEWPDVIHFLYKYNLVLND
jgi:hypothetical protein